MKFLKPNWPAPRTIKSFVTLRNAWGEIDQGHYSKDRAHYLEEHKKLQTLLNLPSEPIWIKHAHSNIVIEALPENRGEIADASFSRTSCHICVVTTADCLPILICDKTGEHVAAIHAGWRGLANNIIEATLKVLSLPPDELLIWLGPAIGPQQFEVGRDVFNAFTQKHPQSEMAFTPCKKDKWYADIYTLAKIRLHLQGVTHIYGGEYCTYSQTDLFFSYRRDKGLGRMASLIWINAL